MRAVQIKTEHDKERALSLVQACRIPSTMKIEYGITRSLKQNSLQRKWLSEAQEQGDQSAEEYRGYCKLHFGVAIMKSESPEWAEKYDRLIRPLDYEQKLEMMMEPMDFPVTRCMSPKGKTAYLDKIRIYFESQGFLLTQPGES